MRMAGTGEPSAESALDEIVELLKNLTVTKNSAMISITLRSLSSATCDSSTMNSFAAHVPLCSYLVSMINFDNAAQSEVAVQESLMQVLVNVSSSESLADDVRDLVIEKLGNELSALNEKPVLKNYSLLDKVFAVLSNVTRRVPETQKLFDKIGEAQLRSIISIFDSANRDPSKPQLRFVPSFFVNLSRLPECRRFLLDNTRLVFERFLPFMDTKFPSSIRVAVMRLVRNCTFDPDIHPYLLGEKVSLLSHLLLPLAGPEEFDDDEMQKLPIDLQYLPDTKTREPDAEARIILLESLLQLCCTAEGRHYLRDHGAYYVLRELHKWEKDSAAQLACENVVDPLISDEPPENMQHFRKLEVPEHLQKQFNEMDLKLKDERSKPE